jgi:hypothetical protein
VGKTAWRTEPTNVEKFGDELCLGVKGQSNFVMTSAKLRMPVSENVAVRQWGISFIVERETTQNSN